MKMRVFYILAVLALCFSAGPKGGFASENQAYLHYLPDVPLQAGTAELVDEAVLFDKAEGRIIESVVDAGKTPEKQALNYYSEALPPLGWTPSGRGVFVRNGEQLTVKWEKVPGGAILRLSLWPKQGGKQEKNFQAGGVDKLDRSGSRGLKPPSITE